MKELSCVIEENHPQIIQNENIHQEIKPVTNSNERLIVEKSSSYVQRTIMKRKKKNKKDHNCKQKNFQVNLILKNAHKDFDGLEIEKTEQNSVVLFSKKNQIHVENHVFHPISMRCVYFVAGDIIVEPRDTLNGEERIRQVDIFNNFRNITSVEGCKKYLQFNLESVKPLMNLDGIIFCLENSQDNSNYEYAQSLRRYQPTVLLVEDLIEKVINQYNQNPSDLQELLEKREKYLIDQQNQKLEELSSQGHFAAVQLLTLSFKNKAIQVTQMSLTKHSIAILGLDFNSAIVHLMRKGFMNFFDYQSRRLVYKSTIEHFIDIKRLTSFTIPSFELLTADGIRLTCDCQVTCKSVEFPEDLQFKGAEMQQLNQIESINVMNFKVTPKVVHSVLDIRKITPSNFADQVEILCFEYAMRSSLFLDKFYPNLRRSHGRFSQNYLKSQECGYRIINQDNGENKQSSSQRKSYC